MSSTRKAPVSGSRPARYQSEYEYTKNKVRPKIDAKLIIKAAHCGNTTKHGTKIITCNKYHRERVKRQSTESHVELSSNTLQMMVDSYQKTLPIVRYRSTFVLSTNPPN